MTVDQSFYRVLDANLNRAREGLRVCEEVARFLLEDPVLTRRCQRIRYTLTRVGEKLSGSRLLKSRDSRSDVGRPSLRGKRSSHQAAKDLVVSNARRVEEALRVLEEFSRWKMLRLSRSFSALRFQVYSLEQTLLSRL